MSDEEDRTAALEMIGEALRDGFSSRYVDCDGPPQHPVHDGEMNVTGGLFAIATALNRIAEAVGGLQP